MNPWIAIVGRREDGRDQVERDLEQALVRAGIRVSGFRQVAVAGPEGPAQGSESRGAPVELPSPLPLASLAGSRDLRFVPKRELAGYDVIRVGSGARLALAREVRENPEMCRWGFMPGAFEESRSWLLSDAEMSFAVAGRLEAAQRGHWPAVAAAFEATPRTLVLSIRPNVLASIALGLPDPIDAIELPASDLEIQQFVERVVERGRLERAS